MRSAFAHGGQAVGYHQGRAVPEQLADRVLYGDLGLGVDACRGLVEDQDARVGGQRPGEADELPLADAQVGPALQQARVVALLHVGDEVVSPDGPRRLHHVVVVASGEL